MRISREDVDPRKVRDRLGTRAKRGKTYNPHQEREDAIPMACAGIHTVCTTRTKRGKICTHPKRGKTYNLTGNENAEPVPSLA